MKTDHIYAQYVGLLERTDIDPKIFQNFKNSSQFTDILEHVDEKHGHKYEEQIKKEFSKEVVEFKELIAKNDSIGNPLKCDYGRLSMSPTNLRYIYQALLIGSKCNNWFNKPSIKIIEIGGGYGGLAFYIKNILRDFNINYTIIDLPEPGKLQKKFLTVAGVPGVRIISCFDIDSISDESFDLVISNYCLSEVGLENQREYFEKLIKKCDKKFFIWNYLTRKRKFLVFKSMSIDFIDKNHYIFEDERPSSGVNKFIYSK